MFRVMMVVVHLIYMFVFMLNSYLFSVFCFQKGFHHSAIILVIIFVHCGRFMCCFKGIISIFSYKMSHICFIFWAPFSALFCFINAHIWLCGRLLTPRATTGKDSNTCACKYVYSISLHRGNQRYHPYYICISRCVRRVQSVWISGQNGEGVGPRSILHPKHGASVEIVCEMVM